MTIFNLYIFNKHCNCIYYQGWNNPKSANSRHGSTINPPTITTTTGTPSNTAQDRPITTIHASTIQMVSTPSQTYKNNIPQPDSKQFTKQVEEDSKLVYGIVFSLKNIINKLKPIQDGFITYKTNAYRLNFYETPSSLRFVLLTDPTMDELGPVLHALYSDIYVEYVSKNPLESNDPEQITNELFKIQVDKFIRAVPGFSVELNSAFA